VLNSIPYAKAQKKAMAGWMAARMDVISWDVWQMSSRRSACSVGLSLGPC
jgi:hypothetical protein